MERTTLCVFPADVLDALVAARAEYPGPNVVLRFKQEGHRYFVQVWDIDTQQGTDDLNRSTGCPGPPGC